MARITRELPAIHLANMLEGGRTPILPPAELEALGFRIVIYGISLMLHAVRAMQAALADIGSGELRLRGQGVGFEEYKRLVGLGEWSRIEDRYRGG